MGLKPHNPEGVVRGGVGGVEGRYPSQLPAPTGVEEGLEPLTHEGGSASFFKGIGY